MTIRKSEVCGCKGLFLDPLTIWHQFIAYRAANADGSLVWKA